LEIHWVNADPIEPAQREAVEKRLAELAEGHRDLIDVRIAARPNGHHRHGNQEVRITCQARGKEIVAARTCPDLGLALHEAFDAFVREVRKFRDRAA
jgi:ribosome-associated translation inhibitor RaiA